jgi:hypothetical protein
MSGLLLMGERAADERHGGAVTVASTRTHADLTDRSVKAA